MATLSALEPDEDWKDGWDDEEELVFDDEVEEVITKEPEKAALFSPSNDGLPDDPAADGWEDEEEIVFDDEEEEGLTNHVSSNPVPPPKPAFGPDGWEDDPLLDDRVDVQSPPPAAAITMHSPVYEALEGYLEQLPLLLPSINACLEAEFSTREKALELVQYYAARPGLAAYTIQTELPRMEYSLRNHHDDKDSDAIVTDKTEIARRLQEAASHDSLLPRAANQSILADVLQVCTGPDVLIRPQYAASCVAAACTMRLDLQTAVLQVDCELELGLPCGEGGRWKVATVGLHVFFCCEAADPVLTYHLTSLERVPDWKQHLPMTARFLQEMHPPDDDEFMDAAATSSRNGGGGGVDFRDAFLQRVVRQGASGMQSAWKEMDAATGLGKRLALPGFLPSDVVEAAEAAQVPSVEPRAPTATAAASRPTSILGGLVRSGWSTLASTVALPEEDPSLYQEWQTDNSSKPAVSTAAVAPSLYRKEAPPPPPSLYRKEEPPRPPTGQSPAFYRKEEPPTPPPTSKAPPTLYRKEEPPTPPPAVKAPPTLYRKEEPPTPPPAVKAPPSLSHMDPRPPPREAPTLYRAEKPEASTPGPFPAVAKQSVPSPPVQEGWDDDDDLDFEEEESTVPLPVSSPPKQNPTPPQKTDETTPAIHNDESIVFIVEEDVWPADFCHDPELDVMPTRQRWMHPRPGSRRLANFFLRTWA